MKLSKPTPLDCVFIPLFKIAWAAATVFVYGRWGPAGVCAFALLSGLVEVAVRSSFK